MVEIHDDAPHTVLTEQVLMVTYQCVQELLANILKHADTKRADIYIQRADGYLEASVIDRGKGFDASVIRGPSEKGGFGLFNIRERLHLLGGRLEVISVPGHGTTARLVVPLNPMSSIEECLPTSRGVAFSRSEPHVATEVETGQVRVLLTEDHQMMREGLRLAIEKGGDAKVIAEAADGETAVELAHHMKPDVVVMDVNLPKMNGVEATRRIKAEFPNIAIIGLSMSGAEKVEAAMRQVGACAYFSKAESIAELCEAVRNVPHAN
jgi:CheY-like chemotaxis protein